MRTLRTLLAFIALACVAQGQSGHSRNSRLALPLSGPGARFAPVPDLLKVSCLDSHFFAGSLWMVATGSWKVRLTIDEAQGRAVLAIPVPSAQITTKKMQLQLGLLLSVLGLFLIGGLVAMSGASIREAKLSPGAVPDAEARWRARIGMSIAFVIVIGAVWAGNAWWNSEASSYSRNVYKPLQMSASLIGTVLTLNLSDPGWLKPLPGRIPLFTRRMDDLIPDHDHLLHLYMLLNAAATQSGCALSSSSQTGRYGCFSPRSSDHASRHVKPVCGYRARNRFSGDSSGKGELA
jgi:hypothetical protein